LVRRAVDRRGGVCWVAYDEGDVMFRFILVLGFGLFLAWAVDASKAEALIIIMLMEVILPYFKSVEVQDGNDL
jgi:hypothetical protein